MAKDAYYFSHDANATEDPKIRQLILVYGFQGYGWFWRLLEVMRSQDAFAISLQGRFAYEALGDILRTKPEKAKTFVQDCISEFQLFNSDEKSFWSDSLRRRMASLEETREKRIEAGTKGAKARWTGTTEKMAHASKRDSGAIKKHGKAIANASGRHAIAKEIDGIKVKESKGKESRGEQKRENDRKQDESKRDDALALIQKIDKHWLADFSTEFSDVDMELELRKFVDWHSDHKKPIKSIKLALRTWMTTARRMVAEDREKHPAAPIAPTLYPSGPIEPDSEALEIWASILTKLARKMSGPNFSTWLAATVGLSRTNSHFTVGVPSTDIAKYLDRNQRGMIEGELASILGDSCRLALHVMPPTRAEE